ncbi:histidine--tRNA ligase [Aquifex aeolicus]|uniref:Histidine--tRNA ligase n=1 Tax=Aquifex aeolicus (strain VF5) TaxID=224324 RepID=SYH_AQUAE|nr:histidine--tRNA ligase [Aquifex aeolicus]O66522.1 RecName: Full=Histidine--tRNA ligase; AltName: Full=Histidyl-tRNA synthetase; Short=HisRS [Aquifex aeolicus VF5]AAC06477.1 histidyl-tRNA synthetase [Aquifex aeolicus VF5]
MNIQSVRGFHDILGKDAKKFRKISDTARKILKLYNFEEIILPVVEYAELFQRSVGETTDIVQKEMFVFEDRKGRKLALRPEGTAGTVRAFIQHKLYALRPYVKLFYEGPMFRYERPQAGRYRQFHQIGAEVFGVAEPHADAEIIKIVYDILQALGIKGVVVEINSLGCKKDREAYREALLNYLTGVKEELCSDCISRMDRNPLRVLDCKVETCKVAVREAPKMIDFLCDECREHYEKLKNYLKALDIPFRENYNLVRGLDYYTRTVFEAVSDELGLTLIAGGRYDYLVEELGGPPTPALGFALGVERLMLLLPDEEEKEEVYFVIPFGDVHEYALRVADILRKKGKVVEYSYRKGGLKKQLEFADKLGVKYAVIIGEDEVKNQEVTIKDMETGEQRRVKLSEL